jgi:predicted lipoprotein
VSLGPGLKALVCVLALASVAACGHSAADEAPALKGTLVQIDDAMVAHDWQSARQTLDALLEQVANARQSGTISPVQAARIRAAAHKLLDRLPD